MISSKALNKKIATPSVLTVCVCIGGTGIQGQDLAHGRPVLSRRETPRAVPVFNVPILPRELVFTHTHTLTHVCAHTYKKVRKQNQMWNKSFTFCESSVWFSGFGVCCLWTGEMAQWLRACCSSVRAGIHTHRTHVSAGQARWPACNSNLEW